MDTVVAWLKGIWDLAKNLVGILSGWMRSWTTWVVALIVGLFGDIREFFADVLLDFLDLALRVWDSLLASLPALSFLPPGGLCGDLSAGGSVLGWVVGILHLGTALSIIGAAYAFRLARKILTLGQW